MRRQKIICLLAALICAFVKPVCGQEALPEANVKAAFLYNFTKFVEWPTEAFPKEDAPLIVGVFADEEFAATLRKLLEDKKAHGHSFAVRRLTQNADAKTCQILFFRETETKRLGTIHDSIKRLPILTVGESDDFLDLGGMINLAFEDRKLRFDINPEPAENARLIVSSKLLRLAKKVRTGSAK